MARRRWGPRRGAWQSGDSSPMGFPQTSYTLLQAAASSDPEKSREAVGALMARYWKPVFAYFRFKNQSEAESEDLVQEFFKHAFVKNFFGRKDPQRGRFRNFLLKSLENFFNDRYRAARKRKAIPPGKIIPFEKLEEYGQEPCAPEEDPAEELEAEELFGIVWRAELVRAVLRRLESQWVTPANRLHFTLFVEQVVEPALKGTPRPKLSDLAARHNLDPQKVANMIVTVKRAFCRLLAEEIRSYALNHMDYKAEFRDVIKFLKKIRR